VGKKHTNTQTNGGKNRTPATAFDLGNKWPSPARLQTCKRHYSRSIYPL